MNRITSKIVMDNNVPRKDQDAWQQDSTPWTVQLRYDRRQMTVSFWTGSAWTSEPGTFDVAQCVIADASGIESSDSFEDWAENYGHDRDSRRAEKVYGQSKRQTEALRRLLGADYDEVVQLEEQDLELRCC